MAQIALAEHRVYPRMRGGAKPKRKTLTFGLGLSPHARGSLVRLNVEASKRGSIPACAGEPAPPGGCLTTTTVYPRMRGGALLVFGWAVALLGLSPHARGSLKLQV